MRWPCSGAPEDRERAAARLGGVGPDQAGVAIPALVAALEDEDEAVAASAAGALGLVGAVAARMPGGASQARVAGMGLTRAVRHRGVEVRTRAIASLGRLAEYATASDPPFDPAAAADALVGAMGDPSERVGKPALEALIAVAEVVPMGPPAPLLEALARGDSPGARARAAEALGSFRLHPPRVVVPLIAALADPAPEVVGAAAASLGEIGPGARPALPGLIALLRRPDPSPPPPGAIPPDPAAAAASAIGAISSGEVPAAEGVAALEEALRSGAPARFARRQAAARALFDMGAAASAAAPALIATLVEGSGPGGGSGYESWAARALGRVAPGSPSAGPAMAALVGGLDARPSGIRAYSAQALGEFGPAAAAALPRLRALRQDPDRLVARMAGEAIGRIEAGPGPAAGPAR